MVVSSTPAGPSFSSATFTATVSLFFSADTTTALSAAAGAARWHLQRINDTTARTKTMTIGPKNTTKNLHHHARQHNHDRQYDHGTVH